MTPDSLPAGPELDRLVAEKVMRWDHDHEANNSDFQPRFFDSGRWWKLVSAPGGMEPGDPWSPSTNIAHAWEVVERMQFNAWKIELLGGVGGEWRVTFWSPTRTRWSEAGSPELAICRAALEAVS